MTVRTLLALLLIAITCTTQAAIRSVDAVQPRSFGYVIGDVFRHHIKITLDDPWILDKATLPENGRVGIWLDRQLSRFTEKRIAQGTEYQFDLDYQIFNAEKQLAEVFTPQLELSVVNGSKQIPVFIHEWGFTVAPVVRDNIHQSLDYLNLQPPHKPVPRKPAYTLLIAGSTGLLFSIAVLGYIFCRLPGVSRTRGPFARACSRLRVLCKQHHQTESYQQALRHMHQAFNETAGQVLLGEDLERFFSEQPDHAKLREPIEQLFQYSRQTFFESKNRVGEGGITSLLELCVQCRDIERGLS